jgi:hypothetical protein
MLRIIRPDPCSPYCWYPDAVGADAACVQRSERYLMSVEFGARALSACRMGKMSQSKWRKPRIKKS